MDFTFSLGWMFGGIAVIACGGAIVLFYRQIAEGFAHGVSSYDRVKLFGVIVIVIGFLMATNLLPIALTALIGLIFGSR